MADQHDAQLIVQLAQWATMMGLEESQRHVMADEFDAEAAPDDDIHVMRVCNFFETLGTLTKNSLLDADLVSDWLWVVGPWQKLRPWALRAREKSGVPQLYENFEALASKQA